MSGLMPTEVLLSEETLAAVTPMALLGRLVHSYTGTIPETAELHAVMALWTMRDCRTSLAFPLAELSLGQFSALEWCHEWVQGFSIIWTADNTSSSTTQRPRQAVMQRSKGFCVWSCRLRRGARDRSYYSVHRSSSFNSTMMVSPFPCCQSVECSENSKTQCWGIGGMWDELKWDGRSGLKFGDMWDGLLLTSPFSAYSIRRPSHPAIPLTVLGRLSHSASPGEGSRPSHLEALTPSGTTFTTDRCGLQALNHGGYQSSRNDGNPQLPVIDWER